MNEASTAIKDGIARKLKAARKMIDYDKEVAAGIYIYAVEELGRKIGVTKDLSKDPGVPPNRLSIWFSST